MGVFQNNKGLSLPKECVMKFVNIFKIAATALLMVSGTVSAQTIANTRHDLGWWLGNNTDNGQICVYCHTPHNASETQPAPPLWNKVQTTSTFAIYSSPTINNPTGQPEGSSLACLTCHDGTLAMDAMINPPSGFVPTNDQMQGPNNLGTDLSNDHPISIGYSLAADSDFNDPATVTTTLPLFSGTQDANYQVECGSCHDVHDDSINPFLRISNDNSALCLTCHVK
jgi:predicted CXXCH cytochrome family protein